MYASFAMEVEKSQGRRHSEPEHLYRSAYQRDRDRVIHTKAFRRLEKKTQVFAPDYSDHFRNRLTHTIEVSQISRTVSQQLQLNTHLCEALALSHDIGHPPYSHEGEDVLNRLMREHGSGFDHNLHALRIVEDFEEKYIKFRGLNLTFEVREGVVKHSRDYDFGEETYIDLSDYRLGERPPLEAQLIDLADEIAYNTGDLDDGYDSGLLTLDQMQEVTLFRDSYAEMESQFAPAAEKLMVSQTIRAIIDRLVTSLIAETRRSLAENRITRVEEVRAFPNRLIAFEPEISELNRELKRFLQDELYEHATLKSARTAAQRQVEGLFRYYLDEPRLLPESHFRRIPLLGQPRVVCDYIAGMTDTFAKSRHEEILACERA